MKITRAGAAVFVLGLMTTAGTASTIQSVTLQGISGSWTSAAPDDVYDLSGVTTPEIRWGMPSTLDGVSNRGEQSGYRFDGAATGGLVASDADFAVGTFTHFNNRIMRVSNGQASTISGAELEVDISVTIGAASYLFTKVFSFYHDETPNGASQCAYGGSPGDGGSGGANGGYGCNDRVTAVLNETSTEAVVVDGVEYAFEFTGFEYNGGMFDFFDTLEEQTNMATLVGRFSAEDLTPVPLPAAGWLLLVGVGGLAAMKRYKSRLEA